DDVADDHLVLALRLSFRIGISRVLLRDDEQRELLVALDVDAAIVGKDDPPPARAKLATDLAADFAAGLGGGNLRRDHRRRDLWWFDDGRNQIGDFRRREAHQRGRRRGERRPRGGGGGGRRRWGRGVGEGRQDVG